MNIHPPLTVLKTENTPKRTESRKHTTNVMKSTEKGVLSAYYVGCAFNIIQNEHHRDGVKTKKRREMEAQRANINQANETPEKTNAQIERQAKRTKVNWTNASPESVTKRRQNAERARKYLFKKKASQEAHKERLRRQVFRSASQAPCSEQNEDRGGYTEYFPIC